MVNDDRLDDLIDVGLAGDLVLALRSGHECGTKAYGQVVWVHHVLITVLGQTGRWQRQDTGWNQSMYKKTATDQGTNPDLTAEALLTYWLRKAKR